MSKFKKVKTGLCCLFSGVAILLVSYTASNYKIANVMYLKKSPITNDFTLECSYDFNSNLLVEYDIMTGDFREIEKGLFSEKVVYSKNGYGSFFAQTGEMESYGFSFDHELTKEELSDFLEWYDNLELYGDKSYAYVKQGSTFEKIR